MSDENLEVQPETTVEKQQEQTEVSIETVAREKGWRPKEEYSGDPTRWKSAEVFLALEEPINKIEALAKELKEYKKSNQMLIEHHNKVKETEFKRALEFLKQEKKAAFEAGNVDKILEVDEKIDLVKSTQREQKQIVQQEPSLHPDFISWVNNNTWYERDSDLKEMADAIGLTHAQRHPNKTPIQILEFVTEQIKKNYPEKFSNPKRTQQTSVESPTGSQKTVDTFEMSEEERTVMNTFVRNGIMSKEDYIKQLKTIKGIK